MENRQLSLFDAPAFVNDPYFDYLVSTYKTICKLLSGGKYDTRSLLKSHLFVFHQLYDRGYFLGKFQYPQGEQKK